MWKTGKVSDRYTTAGIAAENSDLLVFLVVGTLAGAHCLGICPLVTAYADRVFPPRLYSVPPLPDAVWGLSPTPTACVLPAVVTTNHEL